MPKTMRAIAEIIRVTENDRVWLEKVSRPGRSFLRPAYQGVDLLVELRVTQLESKKLAKAS